MFLNWPTSFFALMVQSGLGPHYVYVEDARHVTQHNLIGDVYGLLHVTSKLTVVKSF